MPRQRTQRRRRVYVVPDDFPQRLERFKEESGLSWSEIARRLETTELNLRRWRKGVRPQWRHLAALLDLADELGLGHLFTAWTLADERTGEMLPPYTPSGRWYSGREAAARRSG